MPSDLKRLMAGELTARYGDCAEYVIVSHTQLTGHEMTQLRRGLREKNVRMMVVKNRIARRVLNEIGIGEGAQFIDGPSAILTGECEMAELCKTAEDNAKTYSEKFIVRGGFMGDMALTPETVTRLANIPPLPVLHAQIVGGIQAPVVGIASAFQSLLRGIACALEGIREQKESAAPASS